MKCRGVRLLCFVFVLRLLVLGYPQAAAQTPAKDRDQDIFRKYPVGVRFHGKPVAPRLTTPDERLYRSRIREGVAKGVVFADHYSVPTWGCGAGCLLLAIVDAITGRVYVFPFSVSQVDEAGEPLTFHRNSRAIHIVGSLDEKNSADRWFIWDGAKLNLLSEKPAAGW